MNKPSCPVVIIGCGAVGTQLAIAYQQAGMTVTGLVRSNESLRSLQNKGIQALQVDLDKPFKFDIEIKDAQFFHFAPPPASGTLDTRTSQLLKALRSASALPKRIVYISTTGVYGDCQGRWITEDEPVKPEVDRAKRRLDAETQLLDFGKDSGVEIIILRVAGIYGPGKLPLERLKKGAPVIRESESSYTNRIHLTDLVKIAMAAMTQGKNGQIYHACDGQPGTMTDYFKKVAHKAGLPSPPEISLAEGSEQLSAGMMSYMRESRRLSNEKTLNALNVTLIYPSLREGLEHCGL